jgi:hypothetical protein
MNPEQKEDSPLNNEKDQDGSGKDLPFMLNNGYVGLKIKTHQVSEAQREQGNDLIDHYDHPSGSCRS